MKYYRLVSDELERYHEVSVGMVVKEKGIFAVIADSNDREACRHYIARGSKIETKDNAEVTKKTRIANKNNDKDAVVASWDAYNTLVIAEQAGTIRFNDVVAGTTVIEKEDEKRILNHSQCKSISRKAINLRL